MPFIVPFLPAIASVVGIASGIHSLTSNSGGAPGSAAGANAADPASGTRGFFQDQLMANWGSLTNPNPSDILSDPNYQFLRNTGISDIDRSASGSDLLRSGTRLEALTKFSSGLASDFINQRFSRNMSIIDRLLPAGGYTTGSPAAAGQILANGGQQGYLNGQNALGQVGAGLQVLGQRNPGAGTWNPNYTAPGGGPLYTGTGAQGDYQYG